MLINKEVGNRISMLRPILIIGVVFVHVPGISDIASKLDPGLFNLFAAFFKNGVFRGTVPTMSLIAGFLLFSAGLDRNIKKLFTKKFMTLGIPFVFFNLWCLAFMLGVNHSFGKVYPGLDSEQGDWLHWFNVIFGVSRNPINGPLHFVRDMMVTILMVPLLSGLIRTAPWMGLIALAIIFGTDQDGILIFRSSSLLLFYVGGCAAVYKWNLLAMDKYAKHCLAIFAVVCAILVGFGIDNNTFLVTMAPFLIWPAMSLLEGTKVQGWVMSISKYSFFVFVAHMPFLELFWWVVKHHARWVPYPVFWFATPIAVVLMLIIVSRLATRVMPGMFALIIGARIKPVFVERRNWATRPEFKPTALRN